MPKTLLRPSKQTTKKTSKIIRYIQSQINNDSSLETVQKSLSNIGVSLSERVAKDREKR